MDPVVVCGEVKGGLSKPTLPVSGTQTWARTQPVTLIQSDSSLHVASKSYSMLNNKVMHCNNKTDKVSTVFAILVSLATFGSTFCDSLIVFWYQADIDLPDHLNKLKYKEYRELLNHQVWDFSC